LASQASPQAVWSVALPTIDDTVRFAARIADLLRAGDLVTLSGDLGVGKTAFTRALVRHIAEEPELEVPSPTFTLMQIYPTPSFPIVHADLYRIRSADELAELGWDEAAEGALLLVEWAERIGDNLPDDRLDITLGIDPDHPETARNAVVTGYGQFAARIARTRVIESLLETAGFADATRAYLTGDASTRAYERITDRNGRTALLLTSPPRADGPVVRFGKPYHDIARLAGDIRPFLAMDAALQAQGLSVPEIYAEDAAAGLAIIEDLGSEPFVDASGPIPERYLEAVALLARLHASTLPGEVPQGDATYAIPPYDFDALMVEAELVIDWYAPSVAKIAIPASGRNAFAGICTRLFAEVVGSDATWTLRDFHSPNLIWLEGREGLRRVGIIDFQDCVLGHPAYDVAALLQDARVTVPDALELKLLGAYAQLRASMDPGFDMTGFVRAYAILGAQRATKILGIFARLDKRDGKPQYLAMLPRIEGYLTKGLTHPALAELRAWYETYMPRAVAARGREPS
jgi:tRNA threonylcarbamoyl adenosine modification protein YjeE